ncbi:hypothetical protein LEP1GSC052_3391 [Leptospira kmetyi serovar Malaysia str. Bejo-Iso9]|nr:hypothetical protein LEP1GSC052_3391 [Leptospira kmetyi serovar Malaysia str. Bejo-Iso9]
MRKNRRIILDFNPGIERKKIFIKERRDLLQERFRRSVFPKRIENGL